MPARFSPEANEDKGEAIAAAIGDQAVFQRADVRIASEIAALGDTAVDRFGQLDCIFNNAGGPIPGTLETLSQNDLVEAIRSLVGSVRFGIKHAARAMRRRGRGGGHHQQLEHRCPPLTGRAA